MPKVKVTAFADTGEYITFENLNIYGYPCGKLEGRFDGKNVDIPLQEDSTGIYVFAAGGEYKGDEIILPILLPKDSGCKIILRR